MELSRSRYCYITMVLLVTNTLIYFSERWWIDRSVYFLAYIWTTWPNILKPAMHNPQYEPSNKRGHFIWTPLFLGIVFTHIYMENALIQNTMINKDDRSNCYTLARFCFVIYSTDVYYEVPIPKLLSALINLCKVCFHCCDRFCSTNNLLRWLILFN